MLCVFGCCGPGTILLVMTRASRPAGARLEHSERLGRSSHREQNGRRGELLLESSQYIYTYIYHYFIANMYIHVCVHLPTSHDTPAIPR